MASLKSYALFRDPQGRITAKESSAKSARYLSRWLADQRAAVASRNTGHTRVGNTHYVGAASWAVRFVVWRHHAWVDAIGHTPEAPALPSDVTLYARVEELDDAMAAAKARLGGT